MDLELRHLRLVVALADCGSIGAAARSLGVAQAGASAQLTRLEQNVGVPLFTRTSSGVRPTATGTMLADRARHVLGAMDRLAAGLAEAAAARAALRVGGISSNWFARFLVRAIPDAPRPVVASTDPSSATLDEWLLAGEVDVAVLGVHPGYPGDRPPSGIRELGLVDDQPYLVAVGHDHPVAGQADVSLGELRDTPWLLPRGRPDGTLPHFLDACRDAGFEPVSPTGPADLGFFVTWVVDHGAACLCSPAYPPDGQLAVVPLRDKEVYCRWALRWDPARASHEEVDRLRVQLATAYAEQVLLANGTSDWWHRTPQYRPTLSPDLVGRIRVDWPAD